MTEFGLIRPFDIDHGELDGMSPQEVFVLGYELAQIDHLIEEREPFVRLAHAANLGRIKSECDRHAANLIVTWPHDDSSESWVNIEVGFPETTDQSQ